MRTIIIEDKPDDREYLENQLKEINATIDIIGTASNVKDAYDLIKAKQPDLVFLDIQLDLGGISFDILKKLHDEEAINFEIIFLTAFHNSENAIRALDLSALAFLHKPVKPGDLSFALASAIQARNKKKSTVDVKVVDERIAFFFKNVLKNPNWIAIHRTNGEVDFIEIDQIVYCQADGVISIIKLADGTLINAMKNLGHYSKQLTFSSNFFRISHNIVLNLDFVKKYTSKESALKLKTGETVYASKKGNKELKRHLQFQGEKYKKLEAGWLKRLFG